MWEFPGGKVEAHETVIDALTRELAEELGIRVSSTAPLLQINHAYQEKVVLLDVHHVIEWSEEPRGCEGQPLAWVMPSSLNDYQFPEANRTIMSRLQSGSLGD